MTRSVTLLPPRSFTARGGEIWTDEKKLIGDVSWDEKKRAADLGCPFLIRIGWEEETA
jgi:hypothetical protein